MLVGVLDLPMPRLSIKQTSKYGELVRLDRSFTMGSQAKPPAANPITQMTRCAVVDDVLLLAVASPASSGC